MKTKANAIPECVNKVEICGTIVHKFRADNWLVLTLVSSGYAGAKDFHRVFWYDDKVRGFIKRLGRKTPVDVTFSKDLKMEFWELSGDSVTFEGKTLGTMELGDKVVVSDPCYSRDVWCMTTLENVCPGTWKAIACIDRIDSWGKRCYILELYHESLHVSHLPEKEWEQHFELGVDSGIMSVIDDRCYRRLNGSSKLFENDQTANSNSWNNN